MGPNYLRNIGKDKDKIRDNIRILARIRCGNMEATNKYWLREEEVYCVFCGGDEDSIRHYVKECVKINEWFRDLGENCEEIESRIWSDELDDVKGRVIKKLWREKESIVIEKKRNG